MSQKRDLMPFTVNRNMILADKITAGDLFVQVKKKYKPSDPNKDFSKLNYAAMESSDEDLDQKIKLCPIKV